MVNSRNESAAIMMDEILMEEVKKLSIKTLKDDG